MAKLPPLRTPKELAPGTPRPAFAVPLALTLLFTSVIDGRPLPVGGFRTIDIAPMFVAVMPSDAVRSLSERNRGSVTLTGSVRVEKLGVTAAGLLFGIGMALPTPKVDAAETVWA